MGDPMRDNEESKEGMHVPQELLDDAEHEYNLVLGGAIMREPAPDENLYVTHINKKAKEDLLTPEGKQKFIEQYIALKQQQERAESEAIVAAEIAARKKALAQQRQGLEGPRIIVDERKIAPPSINEAQQFAITPEMLAEMEKNAEEKKKKARTTKQRRDANGVHAEAKKETRIFGAFVWRGRVKKTAK